MVHALKSATNKTIGVELLIKIAQMDSVWATFCLMNLV